jgi:secernin
MLGKNSDRPGFGCQPLMFHPRQRWPAGAKIDLGRVTIAQVEESYATMGSSPYWCWGYEEGINEYGVAIGNEGISSKVLAEDTASYKAGSGPPFGPTGMDLLRLGLERGNTAREALKVIAALVEKHGQFGSGVPTKGVDGAYHNSYIIADAKEAWVLETAGTHWVAKRFDEGSTSISNDISLGSDYQLCSTGLVKHAVERGWWSVGNTDPFDFEIAYSKTGRRYAHPRAARSRNLLQEKAGQIDVRWMMRIARDRAGPPSIDQDGTASSCVAVLPDTEDQLPVFWWCPSVPSNSCYVPFFIHGSGLPKIVSTAGSYGRQIVRPSRAKQDGFLPMSYWWLFRDLNDRVATDRKERNSAVRKTFDRLEKEFETGLPEVIQHAVELRKSGEYEKAASVLDRFTGECVDRALKAANELRARFETERQRLTP